MNDDTHTTTLLALRDLRYAYASALDRRDAAALRAVFHPDAELLVFAPDAEEPRTHLRGHDQIARTIDGLRERYARTLHVVTNPTAAILRPGVATGRAYGVSHHLPRDGERSGKFVVYLVYEDEFRSGPGGDWRIAHRAIRFLWAEESPVLPWDEAVVRGGLG
ncbi:nuclear transport factor 2 family protein [Yinghuangia sp. ASG 101]|uniref:nuclear transport factor 2 family protein n=1 Tax=Yinghuangia sp. ASG 101 TaxID=2896848 RepID=UPI001E33A951|nr:nuclear transport factor 2 family protein [Yinghuangia sp. ASG 101]UGQ12356.1 nuclear transport factor 2 family protein [Yinghuangia sp. ASG 101]